MIRPIALAAAVLSLLGRGAAAAEPDPPAETPAGEPAEPDDDYDPWEGIEPSGRIPAIEKPADLPHPERWRYIPEGRLKPGNLFERFGISSFIAPFFFHSSDVGWGGGAAIVDIDFRSQRRREFAGIFASYSEEQQQRYAMLWRRWLHHRERPEGGVLQEERSFVHAFAAYGNTLTRRFYGFGADSNSQDQTRYSDEEVDFTLGLQRTWPEPGADLILRGGLRGELHNLGRGVGSRPDTRDAFPALFGDAEDRHLGWLEAGLSWDTRDSQANPYDGWELSADVEAALLQSGWELGALYTLAVARVLPLPGLLHRGGDPDEEHPPRDSLALGLRAELSSGELPFFARPSLGGDRRLRGYPVGRFRDDAGWFGVAEYRFWVLARGFPIWGPVRVERVGLALFYELGSVANAPHNLFESKLRHSYGTSLRVTLERAAPFRIDFAFAPDKSLGIIARFGLSF